MRLINIIVRCDEYRATASHVRIGTGGETALNININISDTAAFK